MSRRQTDLKNVSDVKDISELDEGETKGRFIL